MSGITGFFEDFLCEWELWEKWELQKYAGFMRPKTGVRVGTVGIPKSASARPPVGGVGEYWAMEAGFPPPVSGVPQLQFYISLSYNWGQLKREGWTKAVQPEWRLDSA